MGECEPTPTAAPHPNPPQTLASACSEPSTALPLQVPEAGAGRAAGCHCSEHQKDLGGAADWAEALDSMGRWQAITQCPGDSEFMLGLQRSAPLPCPHPSWSSIRERFQVLFHPFSFHRPGVYVMSLRNSHLWKAKISLSTACYYFKFR